MYIDGTGFARYSYVVALTLTTDGTKKMLGVPEGGATGNSDLLANLVERGLHLPDRALFVLDGGKALRKAIADVFGDQALV